MRGLGYLCHVWGLGCEGTGLPRVKRTWWKENQFVCSIGLGYASRGLWCRERDVCGKCALSWVRYRGLSCSKFICGAAEQFFKSSNFEQFDKTLYDYIFGSIHTVAFAFLNDTLSQIQ